MKTALISVSDKQHIAEFARELATLGYSILSTGGTAKLLEESGVDVTEVASYTEFPEMMGGRVKTLHPKIHGGILGRRGQDDEVMAAHGIRSIDIVVVNLYPFEQTVAGSLREHMAVVLDSDWIHIHMSCESIIHIHIILACE